MKIKFNLHKIRVIRSITQKELGKMAGLCQSHISELELQKESPTLKTIETIANVLHIHPFELLEVSEK